MKRPEVGIGYRAAAEVKRLFPKKHHAAIAIGCGVDVVKDWGCGVPPTPVHLAQLHEQGADVIWILTGKREGK